MKLHLPYKGTVEFSIHLQWKMNEDFQCRLKPTKWKFIEVSVSLQKYDLVSGRNINGVNNLIKYLLVCWF